MNNPDKQDTDLAGGCACGHCRYRIAVKPIFVNNCHCRQCQQQTGSTSVVNAFFETDKIELISGKTIEAEFTAGSGGPHIVTRCAECGTALWSNYPRLGRLGAGVRVGTLDDPSMVAPTAVVFAAERMPWVALPEGVPVFEQYYNPKELLGADEFGRLIALVKKKDAEAEAQR